MSATGKLVAVKIVDGAMVKGTDAPFGWFPELENLFRHFDILKLEFTIHDKDRTTFVVKKESD